jgi:hypothetical protein
MKSLQETTMKSVIKSKTSRLVGALFLIAMAASLFGGSMVDSMISSTSYLTISSGNRIQLLIGALLELINAIAVVGIGVLMFPILKKYNERMALGYLCFRVIEALFCASIIITPLSLIKLSQEFLKTGALDAKYYKVSGVLSIAERAGINELLIPVFFCLGAMLFYCLLYKSRLLPRFISIWGIIAVIFIFAMNLVTLFLGTSLNTGVLMILALPIILNEIFLGIWLIVKGFNR